MPELQKPPVAGRARRISRRSRPQAPWKAFATCAIGTPVLVSVLAIRGMRRQGEQLDLTAFSIVVVASTVLGLLMGLTVIAHHRYKALRNSGRVVPFGLRLIFDGQPMKLIFLGVPLLFVIAIAIGLMMG